uniref:Protein kinase domain-containing protein n=1 Tax=Aegilops tauschii subsp. strangulata TaxID=200361 RepID=A0A453JXM2_AEGTS
MPSLKFLDLSSNKLSGSIPAALVRKRQNGSLVLMIGNNANICDNGASTCAPNDKQKNRTLIIAIAVPIAVATLLFVAAIIILHRRRIKQGLIPDTWMANSARLNSPRDRERSNLFENRQFSYKELKLITANFKEEIGRGGFGAVFLGYLENGSPVAVKIRSKTSSQGDREFLSEAQHLSRVHHRNLVSLIGYCKDKKQLALVYEYMHGGDLEDRLRGEVSVATPLSWHRRLKIALDSAHGQSPAVAITDTESIHIAQWVRQKLSEGNIESIADSKMGREYDVNSVWKVTELALQCKEQPSRERPTMTDVVAELKECLELEVSRGMGNYNSVTSGTSNLSATSTDSHNDAQANDL